MEFDYLVALVIFVSVFGVAVMILSNSIMMQKDDLSLDIAKEEADLIAKRLYQQDSGIFSSAYKLYVYAENRNSSGSSIVEVDLSKFGRNDPNSVYILDNEDKAYPYLSSGSVIAFSADIPLSSAKRFVLYYDDDSNFSARSGIVNGSEAVEIIYGAEIIDIVQYRAAERLKTRNATGNSQVVLESFSGIRILAYGLDPEGNKNVVVRKKPVLIQMSDASIIEGWLIVKSWV